MSSKLQRFCYSRGNLWEKKDADALLKKIKEADNAGEFMEIDDYDMDTECADVSHTDATISMDLLATNILESTTAVPVDQNTSDDFDITDCAHYAEYIKHKNDFMNDEYNFEPILSEKNSRYTVFPIKYKSIYDNYKAQQKLNWVVEEVDLSKDVAHWEKKLDKNDRTFLLHVLAFFAAFDGIVDENLSKNLISKIKIKEAEMAYGKQFDMENVHGEMYSLMLETFVKNPELKDKLINSIKTIPCVKKKADWCKKWIHSDMTFAHNLVAFAIVEGIFFSGSFASIFWLKTRQGALMPGLIKSNRFISRDENLHVELACLIYGLLENKLKKSVIYAMIEEAVELEDEFINSSLPCKLLGMNAKSMSQYIRYVADRLIVQLGYPKKYNATNPFEFMKKIDAQHKSNFFEERNDVYFDAKIDNPKIFSLVEIF